MPPEKHHHTGSGFIDRIFEHWDADEELCGPCKAWWLSRGLSFRKELRHTYEFEADL